MGFGTCTGLSFDIGKGAIVLEAVGFPTKVYVLDPVPIMMINNPPGTSGRVNGLYGLSLDTVFTTGLCPFVPNELTSSGGNPGSPGIIYNDGSTIIYYGGNGGSNPIGKAGNGALEPPKTGFFSTPGKYGAGGGGIAGFGSSSNGGDGRVILTIYSEI